MAKNLLDQIISLASGSKWTKDQNGEYEPSGDSSGLSGVEKYLEKKSVSTKTGVARYLEKKAQAEQDVAETEVKVVESGVEKYLKRKAVSPQERPAVVKKASGVEKYLQQKASTVNETTTAPKAKPEKPASGVDKYMRKHDAMPAEKTDKEVPAVQEAKKDPKPVENKTKKPVSKKKATDKSSRCQAATSKGTQCSRTTSTTKIQRTINKKRHYFSVCSQHNNDSFKPFPEFVEND